MSEVESTMTSPPTPLPKATLAAFIKGNSTLVTSFAAFVALTAFSSQLDVDGIKIFLPGITFVGALLLGLELMVQVPPPPHQWRLALFDWLFLPLLALMAWYWVEKFPAVWIMPLLVMVMIVVIMLPSALLTHLFTKIVKSVSTRVFHRTLRPETIQRVGQFGFLVIFFLAVLAFRRFAQHPIKIHAPW